MHWKSLVSKRNGKANINLVKQKFCKPEEVRKYFVCFVKLQYLQFGFQIYRNSRLQMLFGASAIKNFTMLEFIFNKIAGLQEISHELSLYFIREIWIVSLGDTYWFSSAYYILLRVFRFLLFLSFFSYFSVDFTICLGIELSLSILKMRWWSCPYIAKWIF